jgi:hypothetical protein
MPQIVMGHWHLGTAGFLWAVVDSFLIGMAPLAQIYPR